MGKIFIILGKSATGKDTIYKKLMEEEELNLHKVVLYTTRPKRSLEQEGVEYHFVSEETLELLQKQNKVIEHRAYHTIYGVWHYFTVDDEQIDLSKKNYLMLGTLESYLQIREYFGGDNVIPIYIEVEDGIRLSRALMREQKQEEPKYTELCRRFLADTEDFSDDKLLAAGIGKRYENLEIESCTQTIIKDIKNICK